MSENIHGDTTAFPVVRPAPPVSLRTHAQPAPTHTQAAPWLTVPGPITFGARGSAAALETAGFDFSETSSLSWTVRAHCEITVAMPLPRHDVLLRIDALPFTGNGQIGVQSMFVYINGLFVGFHSFRNREAVEFAVQRSVFSGRTNRIAFAIPTAVTPASLGLSADIRPLGLAFSSIEFVGSS